MLINAINRVLWNYRRNRYMRKINSQIANKDFTIFSCNCIGGVLYHDLGLPFATPFVNLYMSCRDFITFCENPTHYLSLPLSPLEQDADYPMARLGELTLHLVHYDSFDQAKEAWERRLKRIHYDRLFLVATNRDGYNDELSRRFDALPYPKVLFVNLPDNNPNHFYIPGYESESQIGNIIAKSHPRNGRRVMDQFDWVTFLNQKPQTPPQ